MPEATVLKETPNNMTQITPKSIVEALDHLPPESLNDVMQFIQFLEYKAQVMPDDHPEGDAVVDNAYYMNEECEPDESRVVFVKEKDLTLAYKQMAKDKQRESEALEWSEATIGDVNDEAR